MLLTICRDEQKSGQTESDLFSLVWRENEGEESEQRDDGARDDEVEQVVETETSNVHHERDVDVRVWTALVHHLVSVRRHFCTSIRQLRKPAKFHYAIPC